MEQYHYYATKSGDGTFSASLYRGSEALDTTTGVKNIRRVKAWAKAAASAHKAVNAPPEVHAESHAANGSFIV